MLITTRRAALVLTGFLCLAAFSQPLRAASPEVTAFTTQFGQELVAVVNGPAPNDQKTALLKPTIERHVDVAAIARFCLGRFWAKATPDQQARYTLVFHRVLLKSISGHLGEYQGVSYTIKDARPLGDDVAVNTTIVRPNAPTADVQWVISSKSGAPLIIDVIAEGTSMRLTQRNDYGSFLSGHSGDIDALIEAMARKLERKS